MIEILKVNKNSFCMVIQKVPKELTDTRGPFDSSLDYLEMSSSHVSIVRRKNEVRIALVNYLFFNYLMINLKS